MNTSTRTRIELNDDELEERCRPRAWERPLRIIATVAVLLSGVSAGISACVYLPWITVFLAPFVALGLWGVFSTLHDRFPIESDRRELAFRQWRAGLFSYASDKKLIEWSRRMMSHAHAPDWLIVLQGGALPYGGKVWVRASITLDAPERSTLVARRSDRRSPSEAGRPSEDNHSLKRPLSQPEGEALTSLLVGFPGGFRSFPRWEVMDGFPCDLVIARRSPPLEVHLVFNLAARANETQEPSIALASLLLQMQQDGQNELLFGMTDHAGNITIGKM